MVGWRFTKPPDQDTQEVSKDHCLERSGMHVSWSAFFSNTCIYDCVETFAVVEYLCGLMDQTEINTRTNGGLGGTPLWVSAIVAGLACLMETPFLTECIVSPSYEHSGHCICFQKNIRLSKHWSNMVPRAFRPANERINNNVCCKKRRKCATWRIQEDFLVPHVRETTTTTWFIILSNKEPILFIS